MILTLDLLSSAIPYLVGLLPVIFTQVIIYNKLKWDVEGLKKSVNGIGNKVNELRDEVGENVVEEIHRLSDLGERVSRIEGILDSIFKLKQTNGHA